jgi:hypothetical protein
MARDGEFGALASPGIEEEMVKNETSSNFFPFLEKSGF